jgi:8-oxo-dGTP diphosphatase
VDVVGKWTGARAWALRQALHETAEEFAARTGIAPRTVKSWHQRTRLEPKAEFQRILDQVLAAADDRARRRFALFLDQLPADGPEPQALRVALAVVLRDDQVLLVLRNDDGAGISWGFPAGIVKPGQRAEAVAVRETRDETGVLCRVEAPLGERTHHITGALCAYYACRWLAGEPTNRDDRENVEALWVLRSDVTAFIPRADLYPPILDLLEGATA